MNLKHIVESVLFAHTKPMTIKQLQDVFPELERPEASALEAAITELIADYNSHAIELKRVASGYRFQVRERMSPWVSRLFEEKPPRYSRALLETLAIIAYRQPVTRGEIEDIRGVAVSSSIIHTLLERDWIKIVAYKEVPGRPGLYATTKAFLDYFNLASLAELPALQEVQDLNISDKDSESLLQATSEQTKTDEASASKRPDAETGGDAQANSQTAE